MSGGRKRSIIFFCLFDLFLIYMYLTYCITLSVSIKSLPHPLILLRGGEDLCFPDEDVTEGPTAATLLVEAGDRAHGEGLDHQGLRVG